MCFLCHANCIGDSLLLLNRVPALQPGIQWAPPELSRSRSHECPLSVLSSTEASSLASPQPFPFLLFFPFSLCSHWAVFITCSGFLLLHVSTPASLNPLGKLVSPYVCEAISGMFSAPKCCIILVFHLRIYCFPYLIVTFLRSGLME